MNQDRNEWLRSDDDVLFSQCRCEFYKATGKGGQKRNKTSSAVRLTHFASKVAVTAADRRSQHENRIIALKKLRYQISLSCRCQFVFDSRQDFKMSIKNPKYFLLVAYLLDALADCNWELKSSAVILKISGSKLVKLLYRDHILWQLVNSKRENLGLSKLKSP